MSDRNSTAKVNFGLLTPNFSLFMNKQSQRYFFTARDAPSPQPPLLVFDSLRRRQLLAHFTRHLQQRRASGLLPSTTARGASQVLMPPPRALGGRNYGRV